MIKEPDKLILRGISGSHLYGLNTPSSDMDIRGIYMDRPEDMLDISGRQRQEVSDDTQDEKYYALCKFLKLASECNPNIIELLWLPDDAILYKSPLYDELVSHREWFMSKRARHTFTGYAYAQIQRAKGLNKKGNSISRYVDEEGIRMARMFLSQPPDVRTRAVRSEMNREYLRNLYGGHFVDYLDKEKVEWDPSMLTKHHPLVEPDLMFYANISECMLRMLPPRPRDYIYWYRNDENGYPFRQVKFENDISRYDASRVEGASNLYRLYHHGSGFFSNDGFEPKLASISRERELYEFAGIVRIDIEEYKKAKSEYDSFWEWMANRNEARYTHDWDSEGQVDWKNMMHTMRLLLCAKSIATTGIPKIRFDGYDRTYLLDIRNGKCRYDDVLAQATDMMREVEDLFGKSSLPHSADVNAINRWYAEKMREEIASMS